MINALNKFLRVSRFNFLPVSLLPYAVGGLFAVRDGGFSTERFILGAFGAAAVHLAGNLFNEYWDWRLAADVAGADRAPHFGGSKSLQEGVVTERYVRRAAWCCLGVAVCVGVWFSLILKSAFILVFGAGGAFIAWAYTARPFTLIYRGLGEIFLFIAFGPLLVSGAYYLQRGAVTPPVLLLSAAAGLAVASVLIANEIADAVTDERAGKRNLSVRLGRHGTLAVYQLCLALAYLLPTAGVLNELLPLSFLLLLATVPFAEMASASLRRAIRKKSHFEVSSMRTLRAFNLYHAGLILIILFA